MLEANLNCLLRVLYLGTESLSAYLTFDSHPLTQETIIKDVVISTKGRAMLEKVLFDRNLTELHYQTAADLISAILGKFPL